MPSLISGFSAEEDVRGFAGVPIAN